MGTNETARFHFPLLVTVKIEGRHDHRAGINFAFAADVRGINFLGVYLQERRDLSLCEGPLAGVHAVVALLLLLSRCLLT